MVHFFDVDIAKEYGVDQAILIAHFQFWITHNAANKKNFFEGCYWTYNSYRALAAIFPYYTEKQVRRILADLLDKKVLKSGNFNEKDYDCTKWYAFIHEGKWLNNMPFPGGAQTGTPTLQIPAAHTGSGGAQMGKGGAQMGKPIPDNTIQIDNTDKKHLEKNKGVVANEKFATASNFDAESQQTEAGDSKPPIAATPQPTGNAKKSTARASAGKTGHDNPLFEQLPQNPGKSLKTKKETLSQFMMKTYFEWHEDNVGVKPIIDGIQGKAMNKLVKYFEGIACKFAQQQIDAGNKFELTEDWIHSTADKSFCMVLQAISSNSTIVEDFYKKVKLNEIASNLPNIINQIKNGNPKNKSATAKTAGVDEIERELRMETGNAFD